MLANYGYEDGSGHYYIKIDTSKCAECTDKACIPACPEKLFVTELDDFDDETWIDVSMVSGIDAIPANETVRLSLNNETVKIKSKSLVQKTLNIHYPQITSLNLDGDGNNETFSIHCVSKKDGGSKTLVFRPAQGNFTNEIQNFVSELQEKVQQMIQWRHLQVKMIIWEIHQMISQLLMNK